MSQAFGPGYFEHGRLIFTVARDIPGMMKVAHKLQCLGWKQVRQPIWGPRPSLAPVLTPKYGISPPKSRSDRFKGPCRRHVGLRYVRQKTHDKLGAWRALVPGSSWPGSMVEIILEHVSWAQRVVDRRLGRDKQGGHGPRAQVPALSLGRSAWH